MIRIVSYLQVPYTASVIPERFAQFHKKSHDEVKDQGGAERKKRDIDKK